MKITPETPEQKYWYALGAHKEVVAYAKATIEAKAEAQGTQKDLRTISAIKGLDDQYKIGLEQIKQQYKADLEAAQHETDKKDKASQPAT